MSKLSNLAGVAATVIAGLGSTVVLTAAAPAMAASGFQNTCSNISFAYDASSTATITAMCLKADGSANGSRLVLTGISNQNGKLVLGAGPSTFQKSCGSITINTSASGATLSALCRNSGGVVSSSSVPLNIGNNNGNLTY